MADKSEVITQKKEIQEVVKQEQLREEKKAEEPQPAGYAEHKPPEKKDEKPASEKAGAKDAAKEEGKKGVKKDEGKKEEKKRKMVLERVYTIPLVRAYRKPRSHRARVAMSLLKQFLAKHAKAKSLKEVRVDGAINDLVLARGARNPPKRVRVLVQKDDSGAVFASVPAK